MLTGVVHEATLRRGRLQVKLGLWPLALVDIEAAAQSSAPATRRDAQWELAQLLEAMDRPEEALAQTERTLTLAPTLTLTLTLALILTLTLALALTLLLGARSDGTASTPAARQCHRRRGPRGRRAC